MRDILKILLYSIFLLLFSCSNDTKSLIQKIKTEDYEFNLYKIDSGTFGESAEIKILDNKKNLIETIGLRGEDYFPKIDSIAKKTIYISYNYPTESKEINFEQVVLGDALIDKKKLKFNYIFTN